jgi:hypothetical protein
MAINQRATDVVIDHICCNIINYILHSHVCERVLGYCFTHSRIIVQFLPVIDGCLF